MKKYKLIKENGTTLRGSSPSGISEPSGRATRVIDMKKSEYWKLKAQQFAEYVRKEDKTKRHIIATLGSFGITFDDDVARLIEALKEINETEIIRRIEEHIK